MYVLFQRLQRQIQILKLYTEHDAYHMAKELRLLLLLIAAHINTSQVHSEMLLPTQHCCRLHLPAAFCITIIHSPSFCSVVNDGQKLTTREGLECGF